MIDIASVTTFIKELTLAVASLLIILDPLGLVPLIITLTRQLTDEERRQAVTRITMTALILLLFFALTGTWVLTLFGLTLVDMRIAGGILLLVIALKIVTEGHVSTGPTATLGVVPLASPLLVGPGAIAAAVVLVRLYGLPITLLAIIISFFISLMIFRFTPLIYRILGESGSDVVARIMGILLAAIAVNFIRVGVTEFIREL